MQDYPGAWLIGLAMEDSVCMCARGSMDRAAASGAVDWRFKSSRAHHTYSYLVSRE